VFNLGTGKPHSLLEVIGSLKRILESEIQPNITQDFRPGDNRHDYADNSNLRKAFKMGVFTGLDEGMQKLAKWAETVDAVDFFEREEKERLNYLHRP
jgi:dTDP-L-rhamnose 4-epimerase